MKILLINIDNPNTKCYKGKFSKNFTYPSLTLAFLKSIIKQVDNNAIIDTCDEFCNQRLDLTKNYDIVMMSFMSIGAQRAYDLAKYYKSKGIYTVAGGYHPTYVFDEVQQYFDTTISGSASGSISLFLDDFKKNKPKSLYKDIPEPDNFYVIPDRSAILKSKYLNIQPVIANPTCPNCCRFCVISHSNRFSKPRKIESVKEEINQLKTNNIFFLDPNFFANLEYATEVMNFLKEKNIEWAAATTIDIAKNEALLEQAYQSGLRGIAVGLESFTSASLQDVRKNFNKPEEYKKLIAILHQYNLVVNGFIILGMDYDTKESLLEIPSIVDYIGLDLAKYSLLTPMPNSELFCKLDEENRILTKDWNLYDQNHVVFQPKNMTANELTEIYKIVWNETYSLKRIVKRTIFRKNNLAIKFKLLGVNLGFKYFGME